MRRRIAKSTALGASISDALRIGDEPGDPSVRQAVRAVGKVHGDGVLPVIAVVWDESIPGKGRFRPRHDRAAYEIALRPDMIRFDIKEATVHEIGHFLDLLALPEGAEGWASVNDPILEEWRQAAFRSSAYQQLASLQDSSPGINPDMVQYFREPQEVFARSYAQWIALRSGDADLLLWHTAERDIKSPYVTAWDEEDFEPVASALDNVFRSKKWMR